MPTSDAASRVLLQNPDGVVTLEGPTRLVVVCEGRALEQVIRRVSTFALVVSAIVSAIALSGAAPRPMALATLTWVVPAIAARAWAARRRREHGRIVIDLEARHVHAATRAGARELPLDDAARVVLEEADDPGDHARWLLLCRGADRLRLAYAPPLDLRPILFELRRHGVAAPHA